MGFTCRAVVAAFFTSSSAFAADVAQSHDRHSIPAVERNSAAFDRIEEILKRYSDDQGTAKPEGLQEALSDLLPLVRRNVIATEQLQAALTDMSQSSNEAVLSALSNARDVLSFRPIEEAPVPSGFPEWTPVGEIRVNEYPAYRMARVDIDGEVAKGFWTLFQHITTNDIAMTAPVSVTYDRDQTGATRARTMAFLYGSIENGEIHGEGEVEVVDVRSEKAVSIGMRGDMSADAVNRGGEYLRAWLTQHADDFEVTGNMRAFGYNSPAVPANDRYFEVQIPVREK